MSFSLRSLYGAVALHRPDIEGAKIQYAVQESARTLARMTMLDRERKNYSVAAGVGSFTITPSSGKSLVRILHLWWKRPAESGYSEMPEATLWFLSTRPIRAVDPFVWAQEDDRIYVAPGNPNGGDVIVELATAPTADASVGTDTTGLPESMAPAIVSWAASLVLMEPGSGMNHAAAAAAREHALQAIGFHGNIRLKGDDNFPYAGIVPSPGGKA